MSLVLGLQWQKERNMTVMKKEKRKRRE